MLKIVTVCGLGVGSSLILKMTVDSAMRMLGVKCDIEHWDMGTVKGMKYDLLVTSEDFRKHFAGEDNVVYVKNIVDVNEAKERLKEYLESKNLI